MLQLWTNMLTPQNSKNVIFHCCQDKRNVRPLFGASIILLFVQALQHMFAVLSSIFETHVLQKPFGLRKSQTVRPKCSTINTNFRLSGLRCASKSKDTCTYNQRTRRNANFNSPGSLTKAWICRCHLSGQVLWGSVNVNSRKKVQTTWNDPITASTTSHLI